MDKFNPVFVQMVYDKANTVFKGNGLTFFRKAVKLFDDVAADGVIIFGFQVDTKGFVDIVQFGRTLDCIFSAWLDFFNILILIFIIFIADLAYDFLKKILECDQTCCGTIFIEYDCQIDGMLYAFRSSGQQWLYIHK